MGLDPVFANPARLQVCSYLAGCDKADFKAVADYCALSAPTLSKHVTALHEKAFLSVEKVAAGRYTKTRLALTGPGRDALAAHVMALREIADLAQQHSG